MNQLIRLNESITLIDDFDLGRSARTGTYVIKEEKLAIVETCASPSIPFILEGLHKLDIQPEEVEYIIVTHIHLDHAGGAGLLLEKCSNAKVVVHPKGARHLANPSRLIAGAKAVYGKKFEELFEPILPIPEEKIITMQDGESLKLSSDCTLTFYDTPGHANHHFSIHESVSNGIFTGDTIGIYYQELMKEGVELYLPTTSPNQFDPDVMLSSTRRIKELSPRSIYFGHFGMSTNVQEIFKQIQHWIPIFVASGEEGLKNTHDLSFIEQKEAVKARLLEAIILHLDTLGISRNHEVYSILDLDLEVCAMGIIDYLLKK
ncbi:MBL fold metallo-hydrolase [Bacillus luteolus]|uniref:MBL fold metallo-hydrolase n=1 Tax=Litchfieldia luteola TaxID=682179 RepID=A0ABR9QK98_9BACI|nr:MBL fold metallo-hydrolase [Cytobacillus luteolus]MBE4908923.1 MBL fold metallo-hydrolase [Cytobacillus luteolus]MBP1941782.1 glyoxylase-like metal-dependent hydrolase (beta-lactamase superfamily II) [Cytobacillus luteolus]